MARADSGCAPRLLRPASAAAAHRLLRATLRGRLRLHAGHRRQPARVGRPAARRRHRPHSAGAHDRRVAPRAPARTFLLSSSARRPLEPFRDVPHVRVACVRAQALRALLRGGSLCARCRRAALPT